MPDGRLTVAVVGGSGYVGGELLRLILGHPRLDLVGVTSQSLAGTFVHHRHPNLRSAPQMRFTRVDDLPRCDAVFLAVPHGKSAAIARHFAGRCTFLVDTGSDHRLGDAGLRARYYPDLAQVEAFPYGLPEVGRLTLQGANRAAGPGCTAAAGILALLPLARAGLLARGPVVLEAKVASSAAGASSNRSTHHPERSGVMRSFAPVGHRHQAEVIEQLELLPGSLHYSATAVEAVRGILVTAHCFPGVELDEKTLWSLYREAYGEEPFVRIVRERRGLYRYPEPRILAGTNYCEVGFELDREGGRVVTMAALDNLGKGAAGSAVQSLNIMAGFPEAQGLEFLGVHP